MKKETPTSKTSGNEQRLNQETVRSVVTSLQRDKQQVEPDIDLDELRAALDELPTINATKVVSLHRRIVNGDYKVDSERLAEKLMELEASLDRD
ncbi:MAG: flagellar biosynthesis anti-sigma factor FlgM [Gammaproteobacteria bacterium]|nr:flagellar biosynthesis anti-sigma factor FlgM [Pseudomonadales bacterium]MBT7225222.1 flagellar biosynthesis anti-sigma factor FlgM [Gammaproteobacteria bacterium]MDB3908041.1 flagellar biosynthesis anti-sigma factor FlgM [Gammaproteobacteria bacterium]MDC0414123.1 flagellar biosynthesis anti-sigma factor FlgM [Gammaproteobacteria bacterium]